MPNADEEEVSEHYDMARAKNRAAQKRYRERRRKERDGIEDQVAVLTRRIAAMQVAHDSLEVRNKSLERFAELAEKRRTSDEVESSEVCNMQS